MHRNALLRVVLFCAFSIFLAGANEGGCGGGVAEEEPPASCEPVTCEIACTNGFATDADGCEVCSCAQAPPNPACTCAAVYAPVCGEDNATYGNSCQAGCADVGIAYEGECSNGGGCEEGDERLADDGCNSCFCDDDGNWACTEIACAPTCEPVTCELFCENGFATGADGCETCTCNPAPPNPACSCFDIYEPVCGEDNATYGNSCEADCVDVEIAYEGECDNDGGQCEPVTCELFCENGFATNADGCEVCSCNPAPPNPACTCAAVYAPVCGEDNATYGNSCEADCVDVEIAYEGECNNDDGCDEGDERLADDGCNSCFCDDSGNWYCTELACAPTCEPVTCDLFCENGHALDADGCETCTCNPAPPNPDCICPAVEAPVCGEDNATYGNSCQAECVGVGVLHEGMCE